MEFTLNSELSVEFEEIRKARTALWQREKELIQKIRQYVFDSDLAGVSVGDKVKVSMQESGETTDAYFSGICVDIDDKKPFVCAAFYKAKKDGTKSEHRLRAVDTIVYK